MSVIDRRTVSRWFVGWSQRVRGEVAMVLGARVVTVGSGIVFVLLTARHLGPTGRGEIAVAFTIAYTTAKLSDLGTTTSGRIHLLVPDGSIGTNDFCSLTITLIPLQAMLAAVVVGVLSWTTLHLDRSFLLAVIGLSVATMMFRSAVSMLYGLRRYRVVMVAETVLAVLVVVALTFLLVSGRMTTTSAVTTMAVGSALCAVWLVGRPGVLERGRGPVLMAHWRTLIVDGISPMVGGFLFFLALRIDRLILAMIAGANSVGLYTVALAFPETLRILPMAVGQVIADRGRSGIDSVATVRLHGRLAILGYLLVLIVAAMAGSVLLPLAFGEGFREAREILMIVTVAEAFLSVHLMQQALLVGFSHPRSIGVPGAVGGVVMVVLDLVMIPAWGLHGAAWACVIGYAALSATSVLWTSRALGRADIT